MDITGLLSMKSTHSSTNQWKDFEEQGEDGHKLGREVVLDDGEKPSIFL